MAQKEEEKQVPVRDMSTDKVITGIIKTVKGADTLSAAQLENLATAMQLADALSDEGGDNTVAALVLRQAGFDGFVLRGV